MKFFKKQLFVDAIVILLISFNFYGLNMVESTKISSMALKNINKMQHKAGDEYYTELNHLTLIRFVRRVFSGVKRIENYIDDEGNNKTAGCKTPNCRSYLNQISIVFEKARSFVKYLTYKVCQDDPASQACLDKEFVLNKEKMVYLITSEISDDLKNTSSYVFGTTPNIFSDPVTEYYKMDIMFKICIPVNGAKPAYLSTSCPYDACNEEEYDPEYKVRRCIDQQ
jgi:hypothetical protein